MMRVSFATLHILSKLGDYEAEIARQKWLSLVDYNDPPICVAAYMLPNTKINVGIIWDKDLLWSEKTMVVANKMSDNDDVTYWMGRYKNAQTKMSQIEQQLEDLEQQIDGLCDQSYDAEMWLQENLDEEDFNDFFGYYPENKA